MAIRCTDCGKFRRAEGATYAAIYGAGHSGLDHEHFRCAYCTKLYGPAQSPEYWKERFEDTA